MHIQYIYMCGYDYNPVILLFFLCVDVHNVIVQMFLKKTLPTMALPISLGQFQVMLYIMTQLYHVISQFIIEFQ